MHRSRRGRLAAIVLAIGMAFGWTGLLSAHAGGPVDDISGACAPGTGVTVVVDFAGYQAEGDPATLVGCAEGEQEDGFDALANAGFAINEDAEGASPGTVCTLNGVPLEGYPACWYDGYWSYWHGTPGELWEFSQMGAGGRTPEVGSVEGWRFVSLSEPGLPPVLGPSFHEGEDTTAPVITLTSQPDPSSASTTATIDYSIDDLGAELVCQLDDEDAVPCPEADGWDASQRSWTVEDLSGGGHTMTITATDSWGNASSESATFEVLVLVDGITVSPIGSITVGDTVTLTTSVQPGNASDKGIDWTSSDDAVATVDENGRITGVGAGTATITATAQDGSGVTGSVTVNVTAAAFDVYLTPGEHFYNGRQWQTACEPYSQTERCRTNIWATQVKRVGNEFVVETGWAFNNLTYAPSPRSLWVGNPLGNTGSWQADDGRVWRTECDTALTGNNGCRSFAVASVVETQVLPNGSSAYRTVSKEIFNNMVRFS